MNGYQLACGHWTSSVDHAEVGSLLPCTDCNALRVQVIGFARGMASCGMTGEVT